MDEHTLLSRLSERLSTDLTTPVRVTGTEGDRPVPVVLIDDWSTTDLSHHNSPYAGEIWGDLDGDGQQEYERYFRFYFETRVEVTIKAHDAPKASEITTKVKDVFQDLRINPSSLHDHLTDCRPRSSGDPSNYFGEPHEVEESVSAVFGGFDQVRRADYDTLEQVKDSFSVTSNL